jgi:uncharacterized protein DUF5666
MKMMRSAIWAGALALGLAACGGGGGGGSTPASQTPTSNNPPPAAATAVNASGVITGFSSVFVNGVKYEVENDTIVAIEGESELTGDDSVLRVGMKVKVRGSESDGQRVAERIDYDEDLKGPAMDVGSDPINPALGTFSVLRQTVIVDANTIFDNDVGDNNADGSIDIRDLVLSNGEVVVEVSGLLMGDGFVATRIDRVNSAAGVPGVADDEYEIKGFVDEVAADGTSFRINDATFEVVGGAGGTVFDDGLMSGLVADESLVGRFVEVKADQDAGGNLIAVRVEDEDDSDDRNGDGSVDDRDRNGRFEIKGILASADTSVSPNVVVIGSTTLEVTDASRLQNLVGQLVELKGTFDGNGVFVLSEAEAETENNVRIEDRVAQVGDASFTTRLGVVVTPTGSSRVRDDVSDDDNGDHLTPVEFLSRLQPNDFVEARAFVDADNAPVWTRVEREDEDDQDCRLRGPVTSVDGTSAGDFSFVIQDVTIDVSQIVSDADFEGVSDQGIGRQAFFDQLSVGDVVEATSDDNGLGCEPGRLTAREVEFEIDDGLVGTNPGGGNAGGARQLTGTPSAVTENTFDVADQTITVVGSTLIDDSIVEAALGRELDGNDIPFDQIPAGLTLVELLTGAFAVNVTVDADGIAVQIEDL